MKSGWERSRELIIPELDTVHQMVRPFLKESEVQQVQLLSGGLNNSNIKIVTKTNEEYVLRIYPGHKQRMEVERGILKLLDGIPVPLPLYHDSSCTGYKYPFMILSWIQGVQLSEIIKRGEKKAVSNAAEKAGEVLAKIHRVTFSASGFFNEELTIQEPLELDAENFLLYIEDSVVSGFARKHLGTDLAEKVYRFSSAHAGMMDDLGQQTSLVHGDFNPLNLLAEEQKGEVHITGVLDWEYALSGTALMDIGNMLRYEDIEYPEFLSSFMQSYQVNGGCLPDNWLQKAKLIDLIALCGLLNKKECGEVRIRDIKRLLLRTMEQWDMYRHVPGWY
ncbi:phosphotransferase family protein [Peribacillus kribbensis]|uniref:phosphotransferase family protein n=1 Tax=Peribacillus kribbensis TaxID=356658 RepID=UPI00040121AB|nr:aminoglycoside phosphotransferase family protein [Peribacillus kribbensis]